MEIIISEGLLLQLYELKHSKCLESADSEVQKVLVICKIKKCSIE